MRCLICNYSAQEVTGTNFDGLMIDCLQCGPYAVERSAVPELNQRTAAGRAAALQNAQQLEKFTLRPTITSMSFGVQDHALRAG